MYDRSFDEVVFDILKVDPEDFAVSNTFADLFGISVAFLQRKLLLFMLKFYG